MTKPANVVSLVAERRKRRAPSRPAPTVHEPPAPPKRPVLREAGPEDELIEGIRATRRVRVTYDADVIEAYRAGGRLSLVIKTGDGRREAFTIEDRAALVEVIEKDETAAGEGP